MEFRTEWDFSALSEFKRARRLLDTSGTRAASLSSRTKRGIWQRLIDHTRADCLKQSPSLRHKYINKCCRSPNVRRPVFVLSVVPASLVRPFSRNSGIGMTPLSGRISVAAATARPNSSRGAISAEALNRAAFQYQLDFRSLLVTNLFNLALRRLAALR